VLLFICSYNITNNIFYVLEVTFEHLDCIQSISNGLKQFLLSLGFEVANPRVFSFVSLDDARVEELSKDKEVLVDEVKQVLQISIHTGFSVNCGLLMGKQVEELD
jgi:hypothetical protein